MEEKINELKKLIETLAKDSSLRKKMEKALAEELSRKAEASESSGGTHGNNDEGAHEEPDETKEAEGDSSESSHSGFEIPSDIGQRIEELFNDDEFITAAAGFVLGAAAVGVGTLLISTIKK